MTHIKAKVAGKVVTLSIGDYDTETRYFYLSEEDCRRLRSEMNRCLQRFVEKRSRK